jgi:signal transduction histidine kinase
LAGITEVLERLISNAVKFTLKGSIRIEMALFRESETISQLQFQVIDSGIGISPEIAAHIFQPFVQEDSSNTRRFDGIGLGLAICKRIIDSLNGSIAFVSTKESGSKFWFRAPVTPSPDNRLKDDQRA